MKSPYSRFLGFAAMSVAACIASMPAKASLVADGITYTLTETTTANPLTDKFTLNISGINAPSDTEGGRYGVQSFALTQPNNFVSATPPAGFTSSIGGLAAGGCNSVGNFYCFTNNTTPTGVMAANSMLSYVFTVTTSLAGSFSGYNPDFKINWAGSFTNPAGGGYDLVSQTLTPTAVPLPAAAWLLLSGIAGMGAMARRRRLTTAAR